MAAASPAVRRLGRDLQRLQNQPNPQVTVQPSTGSMLEWHFVLHNFPADTPYAGGFYHGKLLFPEQYPMAPPSLYMITPSGRLETNVRVCLSMTDFHPESWNPAWTVESLLVGLISFMVDDREPLSVGAVEESLEVRRKLAAESVAFNRADATFCELFPAFLEAQPAASSSAEGGATAAEATPVAGDAAVEPPARRDEAAVHQAVGAVPPPRRPTELDPDLGEDAPAAALVTPHPAPPLAEPEAGPPPRPSEHSASTVASGRPECWICREDTNGEPLIQPCACRGSMSGVHASCVEAWIAHHRTNAAGEEIPKCSVCGQHYTGTERRPGVFGFAQHLCTDFIRQATRSALLVCLLVAYWSASQPDVVPSLALRVLLFFLSGTFFLYKAVLLMVSLPRGRPPPTNWLRHFFTSDFRSIAVHIAETMAIVVIGALWCAYGQLFYGYVLPLGLLPLLPLVSVLARQRGPWCCRNMQVILLLILISPFILIGHCIGIIVSDPKRLADPFDGLMHVAVPIAAIPLSWACSSNVPVLITWGVHSLFLLLGILEKALLKKARWKEGRAWWIFMQLGVLATYVANLLHNFTEGFLPEHSGLLVLVVTLAWLLLSCTLGMMVNWGICVRYYHAWQHRNGHFSLSPNASPAGSPTHGGNQAQTIGAVLWGQQQEVGGAVLNVQPVLAHRPAQQLQIVHEV